MADRTRSLDDAVGLVESGDLLGVGGVLTKRKPVAALRALAATGVTGLEVFTFLGSIDVEILVGAGCVATTHTGYVGFEQLGFAPVFERAVAAGDIAAKEYTEFLFVAGLRAGAAGLPFMPAKGGAGSDVTAELGFRDIEDPYGGEPVIAVPAITPDVAFIHVEAADTAGNVLGPASPDFLWDFDQTLARAGRRVVVTCEELLAPEQLRNDPRPVMLVSYEVEAVVQVPNGAAPTAMPGRYDADLTTIREYLRVAAEDPEKALEALG